MKLSCDLDDTLVGLAKPWLKWLYDQKISFHLFKNQDVTHYSWFSDTFGHHAAEFFLKDPVKCYEGLRPIPGAQAFYIYCIENFNTDIVTHSDQKSTEKGKTKFVKKWFGDDVNIRFFKHLPDKYKSLEGSILVDDYPLHIINHAAHNKQPAILFNYKNENGWGHLENYKGLIEDLNPDMELIHYATNYEEIINILEILKNDK